MPYTLEKEMLPTKFAAWIPIFMGMTQETIFFAQLNEFCYVYAETAIALATDEERRLAAPGVVCRVGRPG